VRLLLTVSLLVGGSACLAVSREQIGSIEARSCETAGRSTITLECDYSQVFADRDDKQARMALDRALITFGPRDESYMHVDLTFTNIGKTRFAEAWRVYIEFDDERGRITFGGLCRTSISERLLRAKRRNSRTYSWHPRCVPTNTSCDYGFQARIRQSNSMPVTTFC